ncbi:hypothetical protein SNEBB_003721 [Seison nebaliae]|nr:hypothetical protein SNEBB_003721 [Seison nebaliae]
MESSLDNFRIDWQFFKELEDDRDEKLVIFCNNEKEWERIVQLKVFYANLKYHDLEAFLPKIEQADLPHLYDSLLKMLQLNKMEKHLSNVQNFSPIDRREDWTDVEMRMVKYINLMLIDQLLVAENTYENQYLNDENVQIFSEIFAILTNYDCEGDSPLLYHHKFVEIYSSVLRRCHTKCCKYLSNVNFSFKRMFNIIQKKETLTEYGELIKHFKDFTYSLIQSGSFAKEILDEHHGEIVKYFQEETSNLTANDIILIVFNYHIETGDLSEMMDVVWLLFASWVGLELPKRLQSKFKLVKLKINSFNEIMLSIAARRVLMIHKGFMHEIMPHYSQLLQFHSKIICRDPINYDAACNVKAIVDILANRMGQRSNKKFMIDVLN